MPISKKMIPIPLANLNAGETDPKVHSGLLRLENGVFTRQGAIHKRKGIRAISGTHTERFLSTYADRPVLFDEQFKVHDGAGERSGGFTDVEPVNISSIANRRGHRAGFFDVETRRIDFGTERVMRDAEVLVKGDIVAVVFTADRRATNSVGNYDLNLRVFHRYTGALVDFVTLVSNNVSVVNGRLVDSGEAGIYCFYAGASGALYVRNISAAGVISSATTLSGLTNVGTTYSSGVQTLRHFDACAINDTNSHVILTYSITGNVRIGAVKTSVSPPTVSGSLSIAETGYTKSCCFKLDDNEAVVAWYDDDSDDIRFVTVNATPAVVLGGATGTQIATSINGTDVINLAGVTTVTNDKFRLFWTTRTFGTDPPSDPVIYRAHVSTLGGIVIDRTEAMMQRLYLSHEPFVDSDGYVYVPCYYRDRVTEANIPTNFADKVTNPTLFFVRDDSAHGASIMLGNHRVIGKALEGTSGLTYIDISKSIATGIGGRYQYEAAHVSAVTQTGTNEWAAGTIELFADRGDDDWMGVSLMTMTVQDSMRTFETANLLGMPNSNPLYFDGKQVIEQGFLHRPQKLRAVVQPYVDGTNPAPTGTLPAGTYYYIATYEWQDHAGNEHVSAPSEAVSAAVANLGDLVSVYIPRMQLSQKNDIKIALYRTESATSSAYKRLATFNNSTTAWGAPTLGSETRQFDDNGDTYNATSLDHSYQDKDDATVLVGQQELYTSGGELPVEPPPPYRHAAIFQSRVFVVPRSYETEEIRYSKEIISGIAPEFNSVLSFSVTTEGGRITALAALHDKLIIFKRNQVYGTHGRGFASNGSGVNFVDPYLLSEAIGCINHTSVVLTPVGVMFLSDDGIYVIDKQFQVRPVGRRVKYHTDREVITASSLVAADNHVVFFTWNGPALVYNYLYDQWSTWTDHEARSATVTREGDIYFKDSENDTVFVQDQVEGFDYIPAQTRTSMTIDTSWLSLAGIGGFKRVYRALLMGENLAAHLLTVKTAYDMAPVWVDSQDFDSASIKPFDYTAHYGEGLPLAFDDNAYMLEVHGSRQKCTAFRYRISDSMSPTIHAFAVGYGGAAIETFDNIIWYDRSMEGGGVVGVTDMMMGRTEAQMGRIQDITEWYSTWAANDPSTGSHVLYDAHGTSATDIWFVGDTDSVWHWDGVAWTESHVETSKSWRAVRCVSATEIYIGSNTGEVYQGNGAGTWVDMDNSGALSLCARVQRIFAIDSTHVYLIGDHTTAGDDGVWFYDGSTWTLSYQFTGVLNDIWAADQNDVYVIESDWDLHRFNGTSWSIDSTLNTSTNDEDSAGPDGTATSIAGINANTIWAAGGPSNRAEIWLYDGAWRQKLTDEGDQILRLFVASADSVYAIGQTGGAAKMFHWNGRGWTYQTNAQVVSDTQAIYGIDTVVATPRVTHEVDSTCVGLWRLNETNATDDAADSGPNGITLTKQNNPSVETGVFTGARGFGPSSGKGFIGDSADAGYFTAQAFTVATWVWIPRIASGSASSGYEMNMSLDSGVISTGESWWLEIASYGYEYHPKIWFADNTTIVGAETGVDRLPFPRYGWHHIGFTWDGTTIRTYYDGLLTYSAVKSGNTTVRYPTGRKITIGCDHNGGEETSGYLCDAVVYSEAKPASWFKSKVGLGSASAVEDIYGLWTKGKDAIWAVARDYIWQYSAEEGWTSTEVDGSGYSNGDIFGFAADNIFAGGPSGSMSRFDGNTWTVSTTDSGNAIYAIWGTDSYNVWVVRAGGTISRWDGISWTTQTSGVTTALYDIWGTGTDDIFVVGASGVILHTDNGGVTWTEQTSGVATDLNGVYGVDPNYIVAVGAGGVVLRSTDGETWSAQTSGISTDLNAVWAKSRTDITAVGDIGKVLFWDGDTWEQQVSGKTENLFAVFGGDFGGAWSISSISVEVGAKQGVKRLGPARNF